jgi:CheY-like chemotaxis protein
MITASKSMIILMADDDADDRLLAKDALSECKLPGEIRFVEDGEDLLDYLQHQGKYSEGADAPSPNLILLDLNMPKKDGREALREIKSHPDLRKIPVVVLTTSRADTDIANVYDLGANSFISKPVAFDALVNVMGALGHYWWEVVELPVKKP